MHFLKFLSLFNKIRKSLKISNLPVFLQNLISIFKIVLKKLLIIFIILESTFAYAFAISGSMMPNIFTNDIVLISRMTYQFTPFIDTFYGPEVLKYSIFKYKKPEVGDVVAFYTDTDKSQFYTKRIIAKENDTIQMKNGILHINNRPCKLVFKNKIEFIENDIKYIGNIYEETLPNGIVHDVLYLKDLGSNSFDNTDEYKIPKGYYFMIGDNRHNSLDSREFLSFIKEDYIIGRAVFILFSNGNFRNINLLKFIKSINFKRCLTWII